MKHSACACSINNKETPLNELLPQGHQDMLKAVHECMAQVNDINNEIIDREMKAQFYQRRETDIFPTKEELLKSL